jgi:translation elongation factor EF-1alpha
MRILLLGDYNCGKSTLYNNFKNYSNDIQMCDVENNHNKLFYLQNKIQHNDFIMIMCSYDDENILNQKNNDKENFNNTKQMLSLVKNLSVFNLIILINKMDKVNFDQKKYSMMKNKITSFLLDIKFGDKNNHFENINCIKNNIIFIPISCINNDNIFEKSSNMDWWNKQTITIDNLKIEYDCLSNLIDNLVKCIPTKNTQNLSLVTNVNYNFIKCNVKIGDCFDKIKVGYVNKICIGSAFCVAIITKINWKFNFQSNYCKIKNPDFVTNKDECQLIFKIKSENKKIDNLNSNTDKIFIFDKNKIIIHGDIIECY